MTVLLSTNPAVPQVKDATSTSSMGIKPTTTMVTTRGNDRDHWDQLREGASRGPRTERSRQGESDSRDIRDIASSGVARRPPPKGGAS
ncbi:hypothetical protein RIF29_03357 [Crotalaria pallida]|uniref:Uncharacterized protein n=1 Tax=Crotalaria pallida TaxID=3830 RepID=A0AAN9J172_CROPI